MTHKISTNKHFYFSATIVIDFTWSISQIMCQTDKSHNHALYWLYCPLHPLLTKLQATRLPYNDYYVRQIAHDIQQKYLLSTRQINSPPEAGDTTMDYVWINLQIHAVLLNVTHLYWTLDDWWFHKVGGENNSAVRYICSCSNMVTHQEQILYTKFIFAAHVNVLACLGGIINRPCVAFSLIFISKFLN